MPEVVKILANKSYWNCIPLVIPLTVGEFFRFIYFFPVNYEFYQKKNQWVALATTITGIINVVLNFLWIPSLGMYGAALATLVSYILCFVFHEIVARKFIGNFYVNAKLYYKYLLILVMTAIVSWMFLDLIILRWMAALIYGAILLKRILKDKELF